MTQNPRTPGLLAALFAAIFAAAAGTHALTPVFPEVKAALGVGDGAVRLLTAVFTLGYSAAGFLLGVLCDRLGRRRVLLASLAAYAMANALLFHPGVGLGFGGFLCLRALAGLATGGISAAVLAVTSDAVPYARRGRAMSFVLSGSYAAVVAGIPLASLLARHHLTLFFGVLVAVSAGAFCALCVLAPAGGEALAPSRVSDLPRRALCCRGAKAALAVTFLNTAAAFCVLTSMADHCVDRFDAGLGDRTLLFLLLGGGALAGGLGAGLVADRLGERRSVLLALAGSALLTPLLVWPRTFAAFAAAGVCVSLVQALRQGPFAAILTELPPVALRGSLIGWNSAASGVGLALGTWAGGITYGWNGLTGGVVASLAALLASYLVFWLGVPAPRRTLVEPGAGAIRQEP